MIHTLVDRIEALLRDFDALVSGAKASRHRLTHPSQLTREAAFGLWRDRDDDGLAYQTRLRDEWNGR